MLKRKRKLFETAKYDAGGCGADYAEAITALVDGHYIPNADSVKCVNNRLAKIGTFVLGDAGSTGTRLLLAKQNSAQAMIIPGLKPAATAADVVREAIGKATAKIGAAKTIIAATAGVRQILNGNDPMLAVCTGVDNCISRTMFGAVEGYLGWKDMMIGYGGGKVRPGYTRDCYMEIGGASAQVAAIAKAGDHNIIGINDEKVISISGVSLGFNILGTQDPTQDVNFETGVNVNNDCSAVGKDRAAIVLACTPRVRAMFDLALIRCTEIFNAAHSCHRLIIRGFTQAVHPEIFSYIVTNAGRTTDEKMDASGCLAKNAANARGAQFTCGRALMWDTWLRTLGFTTEQIRNAITVEPNGNLDQLEWYNGLMSLVQHPGFDFNKLSRSLKSMTQRVSDCDNHIMLHN